MGRRMRLCFFWKKSQISVTPRKRMAGGLRFIAAEERKPKRKSQVVCWFLVRGGCEAGGQQISPLRNDEAVAPVEMTVALLAPTTSLALIPPPTSVSPPALPSSFRPDAKRERRNLLLFCGRRDVRSREGLGQRISPLRDDEAVASVEMTVALLAPKAPLL